MTSHEVQVLCKCAAFCTLLGLLYRIQILLASYAALQTDLLWQPQHWPQHSPCVEITSCCAAQEWQQMPLHNTASRSCPNGGQWKTAVIHVPGGQEHAQLEFVIKNNAGQVHADSQCNAAWTSCLSTVAAAGDTDVNTQANTQANNFC